MQQVDFYGTVHCMALFLVYWHLAGAILLPDPATPSPQEIGSRGQVV